MKILLTGCNGRLGQAIREATPLFEKERGIKLDFTGVDLSEPLTPSGLTEFHCGSYTDAVLLEQVLPNCDAVIHTATVHELKTHTSTQFVEENVGGLTTLLEACIRHGVRRFVFSSTMEILVGRDWYASGMQRLDATCPPRCDSIYSQSKLLCEQIGAYYSRKSNIEFLALRYMNIEPPGYHPLQLLTRGNPAIDVALANLCAVIVPEIEPEVLLVAPQSSFSNQDIVRAQTEPLAVLEQYWPGSTSILEKNGLSANSRFFTNPVDIKKTKRILQWQPTVTFESWLIAQGWKPPA